MASFVPTSIALDELAELTRGSPNDPAVCELFDRLVLRGHLVPFVEGWWEQIRWCKLREAAEGWDCA
jgi:hypothetical protein